MRKTIVFIGRKEDREIIERLADPFVESGWYVHKVNSVEAAKKVENIN